MLNSPTFEKVSVSTIYSLALLFLLFPIFAGASYHDGDHEHVIVESNNNNSQMAVNISVVDIDVTETITSSVSFKYEGKELKADEQVVETIEQKVPAINIMVDTAHKFVNVSVFKSKSETIPVKKVDDNHWICFADSGTYGIHVDTYDPELGLDKIVQEITLGPAVGEFGELAKLASDLANQLDDLPTQKTISEGLLEVLPTVSNNFDDAVKQIQSSILDSLSKRRDSSLEKDWYNGWRVPLDKEFEAVQLESTEQLVAAWTAIATGMEVKEDTAATNNSVEPEEKKEKKPKYKVGDYYKSTDGHTYQLQQVCDGPNQPCRLKWVIIK